MLMINSAYLSWGHFGLAMHNCRPSFAPSWSKNVCNFCAKFESAIIPLLQSSFYKRTLDAKGSTRRYRRPENLCAAFWAFFSYSYCSFRLFGGLSREGEFLLIGVGDFKWRVRGKWRGKFFWGIFWKYWLMRRCYINSECLSLAAKNNPPSAKK